VVKAEKSHSRPVLYRPTDVEEAYTLWKSNCGPSAMAALLGVELVVIRTHIRDWKGYTTPKMARETLRSAGAKCDYGRNGDWPQCGLVCIQFRGPWLNPDAHWAEQYKRSHYIAVHGSAVYDVNCDKWISRGHWEQLVAPQIADLYDRCDGTWYPRSCIVIHELPAVTGPNNVRYPSMRGGKSKVVQGSLF
jgi:hypothetical protein